MSFFDVPSGATYYRSKDPLDCFKIKITLKKVALGTLWSAEAGFHDNSDKDGEEFRVFTWQEKVFSKKELQLFSDQKNCNTVQEKAYHSQIAALTPAELKRHGGRLFTLVDADSGECKTKDPLTNDPNLPETYFANQVLPYRPRRPRIEDVNVLKRQNEKVVGFLPPSRRAGPLPSTEMHLMVDFSTAATPATEDMEYVLCSIRIDTDGLIQMEPDFNAFKKPYLIQTGKKTGEMYEYFIEHASEVITRMEVERENQLFRALYQRHQDYIASLVGNYFKTPPQGVQWISLRGEILDAEGFEYDDLFIHFLLDIPPGWKSKWDSGKEPLHLTTQIAQKASHRKWHFGCPFAWLLENTSSIDGTAWPQLLLEVVSLDSWNRYRIEGYGYVNVPRLATGETATVHTWRPLGTGLVSRLRRFFIGGCPELEDISYVSVPSDFKGKELSRYGYRTVPSGKVRVRLQTVTQTSENTSENSHLPRARTKRRTTNSQFIGLDRGVEDVLEAFKRARRRLLEARGILNVE